MTRMLFTLPTRLYECAVLVRKGRRLADIGTDHALLPIWLLKKGIVCHAIAADINEGPLKAARKNAKLYGVEDKLELRLSDGLEKILPSEADDIVIAGMGGELIASIVSRQQWLKDKTKRLILQPMSSAYELRKALCGMGFAIDSETGVLDAGKIYSVISCSFCAENFTPGELFFHMGKIIPHSENSELYAQKTAHSLEKKRIGFICTGETEKADKTADLLNELRKTYLD